MKRISELWEKRNKEIEVLSVEDLAFTERNEIQQVIAGGVEQNTAINSAIYNIIISTIGSLEGMDILEIGGGYGNLCRKIFYTSKIKSYTLLDTPMMTKFSKKFLRHWDVTCGFVTNNKIEELYGEKFDLVISNICLSELHPEYFLAISENIFPNCKMAFFIDGEYDGFTERFAKARSRWKRCEVSDASPFCKVANQIFYICGNNNPKN